MNQIDWKSYLEGTMPDVERGRIAAQLDIDRTLREELDAYRGYCAAIHEAGTAEKIPHMRLERWLAGAIPKPKHARPNWALRLTPVLGTLALIAWAQWRSSEPIPSPVTVTDPYSLATSVAHESATFQSPAEAAQWVRQKAQIVAPELRTPSPTTAMGAQVGSCWARYDFALDGNSVHLYMAKKDSFEGAPTTERNGHTYYLGHSGIGWRKGGLSYYLEGCGPNVQVEMAERVCGRMIP